MPAVGVANKRFIIAGIVSRRVHYLDGSAGCCLDVGTWVSTAISLLSGKGTPWWPTWLVVVLGYGSHPPSWPFSPKPSPAEVVEPL
jgi:hypothetical protein